MTDKQWKVVIALCKLVMNILESNKDIAINPPAFFVIKEAIEEDKDANK